MNIAPHRLLLLVPSVSSFHVFLADVALAWIRDGGEVAVAAGGELPGVTPRALTDGVRRFTLPEMPRGGALAILRAALVLRRVVREWRPHVVHAHFGAATLMAALVRGSRSDVRWLATFHGMHATAGDRRMPGPIGRIEAWAAARMDQVCVLNREDEAFLTTHLPKGRFRLLHSCGIGCRLEQFDPQRFSAEARRKFRESLGLPAGAPVVAFVGRQVDFKGFATAVRAFGLVQTQVPSARLLLVGVTDMLHPTGLTQVESTALCANPAVVRAGWQDDVAPYLAVSDLCVLPSEREGMPVNLMEALAMGVPVITTDSRGCRDVVRDGIDGITLRDRTPGNFAESMLALLKSQERRESMARAAIEGRDRFDRRHFVEEQLAIYQAVLSGVAS